jgi:hypothetical protein
MATSSFTTAASLPARGSEMAEKSNRLTDVRECWERIIADTIDEAMAGEKDALDFLEQRSLEDLEDLHYDLPEFAFPLQLEWLRNYIDQRR